jgi:hypothetical protein
MFYTPIQFTYGSLCIPSSSQHILIATTVRIQIITDFTVEGLMKFLAQFPRRVLVLYEEFRTMTAGAVGGKYSKGGEADNGWLLAGYDGVRRLMRALITFLL